MSTSDSESILQRGGIETCQVIQKSEIFSEKWNINQIKFEIKFNPTNTEINQINKDVYQLFTNITEFCRKKANLNDKVR